MGKNKLKKFAQLETFPNVYQNPYYNKPLLINHKKEEVNLKGRWHEHFGNNHPITLELACGGGEYTLALAKMYPERNFMGIDVKGNRIWKGASKALDQKLDNVAFARLQIERLEEFFAPNEVAEIWITFPDPHPTKRTTKKRLTFPRFLNTYKNVLPPGGLIHLKTDSDLLYDFTMETLAAEKHPILYHNDDIYAKPLDFPELDFKTTYEYMHLENKKTIKYIRFQVC